MRREARRKNEERKRAKKTGCLGEREEDERKVKRNRCVRGVQKKKGREENRREE